MRDEPHRIPRPIREVQATQIQQASSHDRLRQAVTYLVWALTSAIWIGNGLVVVQVAEQLFRWVGHG